MISRVWAYQKRSLLDARAAGELLIKAKKQVGHGNWLAWLEKNLFKERTANNFIRIATHWEQIRTAANFPRLSVREALRLLPKSERKQAGPSHWITMSFHNVPPNDYRAVRLAIPNIRRKLKLTATDGQIMAMAVKRWLDELPGK
jgi:hypothetical protein